jgi:hypothetical protein
MEKKATANLLEAVRLSVLKFHLGNGELFFDKDR